MINRIFAAGAALSLCIAGVLTFSTVATGTSVAYATPVPGGDPEPVDPDCYNNCWQELQDALDDADDLRDQADVQDGLADDHASDAIAALDAFLACYVANDYTIVFCIDELQAYNAAVIAQNNAAQAAQDLRDMADALEAQAYDDYSECLADCDGDPK